MKVLISHLWSDFWENDNNESQDRWPQDLTQGMFHRRLHQNNTCNSPGHGMNNNI
jgi:hypothetical protein